MGNFLFGLLVGIVSTIVLIVMAISNGWVDIEKIKEDQNKQ